MPAALLALAIGAFGIGTTEFVIMGLLPEVAADFGVSIPSAGLLISGYALGVVVGAPLLTAIGSKVSRKTVLIALMGVFIAGNLVSAVAPSYGVLMTGRIVAALSHGAFFGVGSVVAASLVPKAKQASAIALMFTGLTVANVLGVPGGTALGQQFGWQSTFWAVTALGVIGLLGIVVLVPRQDTAEGSGAAQRAGGVQEPAGVACVGYDGPGVCGCVCVVHLHRTDDDRGRRLLRRCSDVAAGAVRRGARGWQPAGR